MTSGLCLLEFFRERKFADLFAINRVMPKCQLRVLLVFAVFQFAGKESTLDTQKAMDGPPVTRFPTQLVFFTSGATPKFPQVRLFVHRCVLPVSISAQDEDVF